MIEEKAHVISVFGGAAQVETQRKSACGQCQMNKGCGTATIAKIFSKRTSSLTVKNDLNAKVGDQVVIGIDPSALLQGSLLVYIFPLFLLFLFSWFGTEVSSALNVTGEPLTIFMGLSGLALGFWFNQRFTSCNKTNRRFHPVIIKIIC